MPVYLIDKIKPKNDGDFAMVDAEDFAYQDGRLSDYMPVCMTQEEYNALVAAGKASETTPYLISGGTSE